VNRLDIGGAGAYQQSDQAHEYTYDPGIVPVPVAGRTAAHRLIRLHGGIGTRTINWTTARLNRPPYIPTMADTSGDTFIGGSVVPSLPTPSASKPGHYNWQVSGSYTYVQNTPRVVGTDALPVGQHPFPTPAPAGYVPSAVAQLDMTTATLNEIANALVGSVKVDPTGDFAWPFLMIPAQFTSDHILRD